MNNSKLLLLLISFVVYVNYTNYFLPNRSKLHMQIEVLNHMIARERKLNSEKLNTKKLQLPYDKLFYDGKKLNYSQAMGDFQEKISDAAKNSCTVKRIKWAQVPLSTKWYDVLKMNLTLGCTPKNMFIFIDKLRKNDKIYNIHDLTVYKVPNKAELLLNMHLISYRIHHEK